MNGFRGPRHDTPQYVPPPTWGQFQSAGGGGFNWGNLPWQQIGGYGLTGLGLVGDFMTSMNQPELDLPEFGQQYLGQARQMLAPQLQAAYAQNAAGLARSQQAIGATFAGAGMRRSGALPSAINMAQSDAASRNMQALANWQNNLNQMATQLYQLDMQRLMAEYEAKQQQQQGGLGGFLGQLGSLGPLLLLA